MMRDGDKFDSYSMLAEALGQLKDIDWHLTVVGDGPARDGVKALFDGVPEHRITWRGKLEPDDVAQVLSRSAIYVWPGNGEAFGLAYLEAQAVGLPVIAQETAGVPEVVADGDTGILTQAGDVGAFAVAIRKMLNDEDLRQQLGAKAREKVRDAHSIEMAAERLDALLQRAVWKNG